MHDGCIYPILNMKRDYGDLGSIVYQSDDPGIEQV
jgi:hypothetical protein